MPPLAPSSGPSRPPSPLPRAVIELSHKEANYDHEKRVGSYRIGRRLGEGAFAKVKEGMHIITGEKVAVKIIDKKKARADKYVALNMRREAQLMKMVCHPNILRLLEELETTNTYYLVTEIAEGGDLLDHIQNNNALHEEEVRGYIRQIVSAVDHIHRAGIIHRDLKIENLLLDSRQNIKIIDFGLSNTILPLRSSQPAENHCKTQCGSPAYAAPELLGREPYGVEVDVWSIGVNLFAMLTGELPFTVDPFNITELRAKMLSRRMTPIPSRIHVSPACMDLLHQLLNPSRHKRIQLSEVFQHPWLDQTPTTPFSPAPFPNTLSLEELDASILAHMVSAMSQDMIMISTHVVDNKATPCAATYHLLAKRLARYIRNHPEEAKKKERRQLAASKRRSMLIVQDTDKSDVPVINEDELLEFIKLPTDNMLYDGQGLLSDEKMDTGYGGQNPRRHTWSSQDASGSNSSEISPVPSAVQSRGPFSPTLSDEDDLMSRTPKRQGSFTTKKKPTCDGGRPMKKSVSAPRSVGHSRSRIPSLVTSPGSPTTPDGRLGHRPPSPSTLKRGVEHAFPTISKEKASPQGVWLPPAIDSGGKTMMAAASGTGGVLAVTVPSSKRTTVLTRLGEHQADAGHTKRVLPSAFKKALSDVRSGMPTPGRGDARPSNLPLSTPPRLIKKNTFFQQAAPPTTKPSSSEDRWSRRNSFVEELPAGIDHLPAIHPRGSISADKRSMTKHKSMNAVSSTRPHTTGTPAAVANLKPVSSSAYGNVPVKFFTVRRLCGLPKLHALQRIVRTLDTIHDVESVSMEGISVKCLWCEVGLDISLPDDSPDTGRLRFERVGSGGNRLRYNEICDQIIKALNVAS